MGRSVKMLSKKFKERFFRLQTARFVTNLVFVVATVSLLYNQTWDFKYELIAFVVMFGTYYALQQLFVEINKNDFPSPQKRYTHKSENGAVYIYPKDYHQAILRLSEFEDYMQE